MYQLITLDELIAVTDCGPLTNPKNGYVDTSNGTVFQSRATYTCSVVTGSSFRTCGADGSWSLSVPTCSHQIQSDLFLGSEILPSYQLNCICRHEFNISYCFQWQLFNRRYCWWCVGTDPACHLHGNHFSTCDVHNATEEAAQETNR